MENVWADTLNGLIIEMNDVNNGLFRGRHMQYLPKYIYREFDSENLRIKIIQIDITLRLLVKFNI